MSAKLNDLHLAALHERAAQAGVPQYRLLEREELIKAIEEAQDDGTSGRGRRRPSAKDREDQRDERPPIEEAETEPVIGVLDRMPQGFGFLRLSGLGASEGDVYVSASQIRRCELWPGDRVAGPARDPRRGERHRALVRVEEVNGHEPEDKRVKFEDLETADPERELPLGDAKDLGPLSYGQRVLVLAGPGPERGDTLRGLAKGAGEAGARVRVLLDDEAAEEAEDWEGVVAAEEVIAPDPEQQPRERIRSAELAVGNAKRLAEGGEDVVVIIDSLSRLALGYRDPTQIGRAHV